MLVLVSSVTVLTDLAIPLVVGKNLRLRHLSPDCRALLEKAGDLMEVNVIEDPQYRVAVDYGTRGDAEEPQPAAMGAPDPFHYTRKLTSRS